jgi:glycosyltransferase involved in cell wall biosynthesis
MGIPDDAFLVMMNAANIKAPHIDRKAWDPNLRAFGAFARAHDDVYIYLHTDPTRDNGFPIPAFLNFAAVPQDRVRITDVMAYRTGLIKSETVAELYSASDVLLSCSMGEGFGLPVAEAMACGTPAIVTDFSAQPEIVADTGWKVPYQPYYDHMQLSDMAWPETGAIYEALEEAYAERGTKRAKERSAAAEAHIRAEYDADTVYDQKWRPLLAELEADLKPAVPRKAMSKAAKRRMKRAA